MIRANDLWKSFVRCDALRGLTFDVPEGRALALIGANGAGKTTAIKILIGILKPPLAVCSGGLDSAVNFWLDAIRHGLQRESPDATEEIMWSAT